LKMSNQPGVPPVSLSIPFLLLPSFVPALVVANVPARIDGSFQPFDTYVAKFKFNSRFFIRSLPDYSSSLSHCSRSLSLALFLSRISRGAAMGELKPSSSARRVSGASQPQASLAPPSSPSSEAPRPATRCYSTLRHARADALCPSPAMADAGRSPISPGPGNPSKKCASVH
jgi:hypothetical protein